MMRLAGLVLFLAAAAALDARAGRLPNWLPLAGLATASLLAARAAAMPDMVLGLIVAILAVRFAGFPSGDQGAAAAAGAFAGWAGSTTGVSIALLLTLWRWNRGQFKPGGPWLPWLAAGFAPWVIAESLEKLLVLSWWKP